MLETANEALTTLPAISDRDADLAGLDDDIVSPETKYEDSERVVSRERSYTPVRLVPVTPG